MELCPIDLWKLLGMVGLLILLPRLTDLSDGPCTLTLQLTTYIHASENGRRTSAGARRGVLRRGSRRGCLCPGAHVVGSRVAMGAGPEQVSCLSLERRVGHA